MSTEDVRWRQRWVERNEHDRRREKSPLPFLYPFHMGGESVAKARYDEWLTEDGLMRIEAWAREGLTEEQIAAQMGISVRTLGNWKNDHVPILQALKRGKAPVDAKVENALLRRALGYQYEEITEVPVMDPTTGEPVKNPKTGRPMMQVVKRVTKHVAPDTTAQIYWLKNRRPDKWRDKPADPNGASEDDSKTIRVVFDPLPEDDNDGH